MKKRGPEMDDSRKEARMAALMGLKEAMREEMGKDIGPHMEDMKKVSVSSPSQQGLEEGLDKAKSLLHDMPEMEGSEESEPKSPKDYLDEMHKESPKDQDMQLEEMQQKLMELQDQIRRLKGA